MCAEAKSPYTGQPVQCVAAGGLFNGQSLAAALMLGASAVWIGTRFVLSEEAGAPKGPPGSRAHQLALTTMFAPSSLLDDRWRVRTNEYIDNWEMNRQAEIKTLTEKGTIPVESDFEKLGDDMTDEMVSLHSLRRAETFLTNGSIDGQCSPVLDGGRRLR